MKKYTFQDLILDKDTDVAYYRCSAVDEEIKKLRDKVTKAYNLIMKNSTNGKCKDWNAGWRIIMDIIKDSE